MMRLKKEDIPVILSILFGGSVALCDLTEYVRAFLVVFIFSLGWLGRKKIKDKIMKNIREISEEIKENLGVADINKLREFVPSEVNPLIDVLDKLVEKVQEKEIQKIENETLREQVKELKKVKEKVDEYKEEIDKMKTKIHYLQIIYDITAKITSDLNIDSLTNFIVRTVGENLDVGNFAILLKDGDSLEVKAVWGFSPSLKNVRFSPTEGVSGLAFSTGQIIYIPDTKRDGRYLYWKGEYSEDGSFLSIPLKYRDEVLGLFNFNKPKVGGFSDEEIELLKKIADQSAVAIKNAYLFGEVKNLYSMDSLTGLLNRTTMIKKIEEIIEKKQVFSFALFDVDGLREINMKFGYTCGDKLISEIARVIKTNIRTVDFASRFGGDEFAIVFLGAPLEKAFEEVQKISHKISKLDKRFVLSISGGISEFPREGKSINDVFEITDRKLLLAKKMGGKTIISHIE